MPRSPGQLKTCQDPILVKGSIMGQYLMPASTANSKKCFIIIFNRIIPVNAPFLAPQHPTKESPPYKTFNTESHKTIANMYTWR